MSTVDDVQQIMNASKNAVTFYGYDKNKKIK